MALRLDTLSLTVSSLVLPSCVSIVVALPVFWMTGMYRGVFRYSGGLAGGVIIRATIIYGLLFAFVITLISLPNVPRSIGLGQPVILFSLVCASRWITRSLLATEKSGRRIARSGKVILIYGAGMAGRQLAEHMASSFNLYLAAFIDDDNTLWGGTIEGKRVYNPKDRSILVEKYGVTEIWLAMPTISVTRRRDIIKMLRTLSVHVRTLPSLSDLSSGKVKPSDIKDLDIHDLLGRPPVEAKTSLIAEHILHKTVIVTGAGGSIGSELCRQISKLKPRRLILLDHSEYALYSIHQELLSAQGGRDDRLTDHDWGSIEDKFPLELIPILASVTNETLINRLFTKWRPETVLHAAAFKHVPMVERNVCSAIINNVWGTYICAKQAALVGTKCFLLISTDKAVRPTNVMGATKRQAELVIQAIANSQSAVGCSFSAVRFGNVLGSSGSVVPLFREQISSGGPITLTHPDITRYFMTINEATQLVLHAAAMARGGEVFVLDMGEPVKVLELARRMIEFSGLTVKEEQNPTGDVEIKITGLRPGEKLYEELLISGSPEKTTHPKIFKARESHIDLAEIEPRLQHLMKVIAENNLSMTKKILADLVPEYTPSAQLVDWTCKTSQ